jgi:5-methylcytosine-specific restriction enzyme A
MKTYVINTDAAHGATGADIEWLRRGVAVMSGAEKYREQLLRPQAGDRIALYVKNVGITAVGTALDGTVIKVIAPNVVNPAEPFEYHRAVRWEQDLRATPISVADVRRLLGQTPIQALQQVKLGESALLQQIAAVSDQASKRQAGPFEVAIGGPVAHFGAVFQARVVESAMNPIEAARSFVFGKVQKPALESLTLPPGAKYKVRSSNVWLSNFRRVGDLHHYLRRFDAAKDDPLYVELKEHGLLTFEDIEQEFAHRFGIWSQDRTRPSDFVIGDQYSTYDILIFADVYDTRAGGMFVIEAEGRPSAVVIKATLESGSYPNQWLEDAKRLKYFLKAIDGVFGEHFKPNAAILNNPGIPVLTFVRAKEGEDFTYRGVFVHKTIHRAQDGSKWFELVLAESQPNGVVAEASFVQQTLEQQVKKALADDREARLLRLKSAPKMPVKITQTSTAFLRNPDVVAEVLEQAKGFCGACSKPAPFLRASDATPYLEVHHKIPLAAGGEDTVENAIALCPNCHRERHFGQGTGAAAVNPL